MKNATPSSSRTSLVTLHQWAVRFNLKRHLSDVNLADILAGDTCVPICMVDLEKYLTFVEYTVENLQFLMWFQDYRERYLKVIHEQSGTVHDVFVSSAPNCAQTERRAAESLAKLEEIRKEAHDALSPTSPTDAESPKSPSPVLSECTRLATPPSAHTISKANDRDTHRFRTECLRAVATFLSPGAAKELLLDAIVRDTAVRNVSLDCHPNSFLPVYEEIYSLVERCSLPRFLSMASTNINLPKQTFIYSIGICMFASGLLITLLLIMIIPIPPEANRAWRLFSVGLCSFGSASCYSAWRGYCGYMCMHGNTQLRVWEMQEMDAESMAFVDRILGRHKGAARIQEDMASPPEHEGNKHEPGACLSAPDLATIAPFTIEPSYSSDTIPSYGWATTTAPVHHFHRPPVFGPETVVLDPRIKAVHRQILIDMFFFGMCFMVVFSALVFAVPSRSHHS